MKTTPERLAELAHQQWSEWMEYLFSKCFFVGGLAIIPRWAVQRWKRQIAMSYSALSKEEKESDRREANRFIEVCVKRLETYALSLEICQHIGLPDPIEAVHEAARRLRE